MQGDATAAWIAAARSDGKTVRGTPAVLAHRGYAATNFREVTGGEMFPPAQAVVLIALVAALGLANPLVGLFLVAAAGVVCNLAPRVLVPRRVPTQPAECL